MATTVGLFIRTIHLQYQVLTAVELSQSFRHTGLNIKKKAPYFKLNDTEGHEMSSEDFLGWRSLFVFSSIKCQACQQIYHQIRTISLTKTDLRIVLISKGSIEENRQLVKKEGFDFPVLNSDHNIVNDYQVPGVPFFYLLDKNGIIINSSFGVNGEQLEKMISLTN